MKKAIIISILFLLFIFQLTLMPRLTVFGVFGNILLAAVFVLAVKLGGSKVLFIAFLSGLALDFFSGLPFGVWAISSTVTIWLLETAGKRIFQSSDFSGRAFLVLSACLFFSVFLFFLLEFFSWLDLGQNSLFWQSVLQISLPEFFLNSVLALIFLALVNFSYGLRPRI